MSGLIRKNFDSGSVDLRKFFLAAEATQSGMLNRAIAYAASVGRGIDMQDQTYSIQNITIKNGLRYLRNGKLTPTGRFGQAAIILEGGTMGGEAVTRCKITDIEMDCTNHPMHCIYGEGVTYCRFEKNDFYNLSNAAGVNHGILLNEGSSYNRISKNSISCEAHATSGVMIGLFSAGVDDFYGYFANGTGNITQPAAPNEHNVISENNLHGGQQGIWTHASNHNVINSNVIRRPRDRGINLIASSHNSVTANNIFDPHSSGINLAYGCTQNVVVGNKIKQLNSVGGEAGIQAYVGCGGNTIADNSIQTRSNFGIYVAVSSNMNLIHDNRIEGYAIAAIAIQSDWWGSAGQGVYGRPGYGEPATGSKWAMGDTFGNSIKNNLIGDPFSSGATCGIALIQWHSPDMVTQYKLLGTDVANNKITTTVLTHNLYVFSDVAAGVAGGSLIGNTFANPALTKFGGNNTGFGPDGYSYAFDVIESNSGINSLQSFTPVMKGSTTAGAATYTVQHGRYRRISKEYVEIEVNLTYSGHTGTGGVTIPLPTASQHAAIGGGWAAASVVLQSVPLTAGKWPCAAIGSGTTDITFYEMGTNGGASLLLCSGFGNIYVSGKYRYRNLI